MNENEDYEKRREYFNEILKPLIKHQKTRNYLKNYCNDDIINLKNELQFFKYKSKAVAEAIPKLLDVICTNESIEKVSVADYMKCFLGINKENKPDENNKSNYKMTGFFIGMLVFRGILSYNKPNDLFEITEKGKEFVDVIPLLKDSDLIQKI